LEIQQNKTISNLSSEQTKRIGFVNNLIYLFLIVVFAKIVYEFTFFESKTNVSLAITATLSLIAMISVICVFRLFNKKLRILWMLFVLSVLISYLTHFSGLEYICNTFTFLGLLSILPYSRLRPKFIRKVVLVFTVYILILFVFASRFESKENLINLNTNSSGIAICLFEIIILALSKTYSKNAVMKYVCYFLAIVSLVMQFQFASRSSMLGTAVLLFYLIFARTINRFKPSTFRRLVWILAIGAILFAYFYSIILFNALGHGKVFFMGKDIFTGRQIIWSTVFERLNGHLIFGVGNSDVYDMTIHNQMLGYMYCFGLIVTICFTCLLAYLTMKLTQKKSRYLSVSIIVFLVISFFETMIYSSYNIAFIAICIIVTYSCDTIFTKKELKNG